MAATNPNFKAEISTSMTEVVKTGFATYKIKEVTDRLKTLEREKADIDRKVASLSDPDLLRTELVNAGVNPAEIDGHITILKALQGEKTSTEGALTATVTAMDEIGITPASRVINLRKQVAAAAGNPAEQTHLQQTLTAALGDGTLGTSKRLQESVRNLGDIASLKGLKSSIRRKELEMKLAEKRQEYAGYLLPEERTKLKITEKPSSENLAGSIDEFRTAFSPYHKELEKIKGVLPPRLVTMLELPDPDTVKEKILAGHPFTAQEIGNMRTRITGFFNSAKDRDYYNGNQASDRPGIFPTVNVQIGRRQEQLTDYWDGQVEIPTAGEGGLVRKIASFLGAARTRKVSLRGGSMDQDTIRKVKALQSPFDANDAPWRDPHFFDTLQTTLLGDTGALAAFEQIHSNLEERKKLEEGEKDASGAVTTPGITVLNQELEAVKAEEARFGERRLNGVSLPDLRERLRTSVDALKSIETDLRALEAWFNQAFPNNPLVALLASLKASAAGTYFANAANASWAFPPLPAGRTLDQLNSEELEAHYFGPLSVSSGLAESAFDKLFANEGALKAAADEGCIGLEQVKTALDRKYNEKEAPFLAVQRKSESPLTALKAKLKTGDTQKKEGEIRALRADIEKLRTDSTEAAHVAAIRRFELAWSAETTARIQRLNAALAAMAKIATDMKEEAKKVQRLNEEKAQLEALVRALPDALKILEMVLDPQDPKATAEKVAQAFVQSLEIHQVAEGIRVRLTKNLEAKVRRAGTNVQKFSFAKVAVDASATATAEHRQAETLKRAGIETRNASNVKVFDDEIAALEAALKALNEASAAVKDREKAEITTKQALYEPQKVALENTDNTGKIDVLKATLKGVYEQMKLREDSSADIDAIHNEFDEKFEKDAYNDRAGNPDPTSMTCGFTQAEIAAMSLELTESDRNGLNVRGLSVNPQLNDINDLLAQKLDLTIKLRECEALKKNIGALETMRQKYETDLNGEIARVKREKAAFETALNTPLAPADGAPSAAPVAPAPAPTAP